MAMQNFQHVTPPLRLFHGPDSLAHLGRELDRIKSQRAVVVCGDLSRNPGASGDWWVMDASAASENLLLAAHALGLGAVWTGVYPRGERVEAVRRVLGLPADVVPLNLIPVGYPADNLAPKQKWNPANVRYNGWAE